MRKRMSKSDKIQLKSFNTFERALRYKGYGILFDLIQAGLAEKVEDK